MQAVMLQGVSAPPKVKGFSVFFNIKPLNNSADPQAFPSLGAQSLRQAGGPGMLAEGTASCATPGNFLFSNFQFRVGVGNWDAVRTSW